MPEDVVQIGLDAIHRRMAKTVAQGPESKKDDELILFFSKFFAKEFSGKRSIGDFAFFIGCAVARLGQEVVRGARELEARRNNAN